MILLLVTVAFRIMAPECRSDPDPMRQKLHHLMLSLGPPPSRHSCGSVFLHTPDDSTLLGWLSASPSPGDGPPLSVDEGVF